MSCEHDHFEEILSVASIGETVPEFVMEAYDPEDCGFCEVKFEEIKKLGNGLCFLLSSGFHICLPDRTC